MKCHDKTPVFYGFVTKNNQILSNITEDLHMSRNVTMFFETFLMILGDLNMVIFDDPDVTKCHEVKLPKNHHFW